MGKHNKNKIDTKFIFNKGNKLVFNNFIAFFLTQEPRCIIVIASKKIGNAVKRNRSKRRLRELLRLHIIPKAPLNKTILLIARTSTYQSPFSNLIKEADDFLNKINR